MNSERIMSSRISITALLVLAVLLCTLGCRRRQTPVLRRAVNLAADRVRLKERSPILQKRYTLDDLIQHALVYNMDAMVARQEEAIRREAETEARRKLLPMLMFNLNRTRRSNFDASKSATLFDHKITSKVPSYSEPKEVLTLDASMTWSLVDFGISYFKQRQAKNQAVIASEQLRKNIHQLTLDVTQAYWQAQVAARAMAGVKQLQTELDARRVKMTKQVESRDVSKIEGAETLADLMETELRIENYRKQWLM
ncbi:MAG: TolC family protein, partial [Planctomycetota bacterium]